MISAPAAIDEITTVVFNFPVVDAAAAIFVVAAATIVDIAVDTVAVVDAATSAAANAAVAAAAAVVPDIAFCSWFLICYFCYCYCS